ncbi:MAG TPA: hypothetical protein VGF86_08375 [Candidatus Tumulicola sp.]
MLAVRAVLAVAMVACGLIVLLRVGALGLRVESLPGLVLGAAMIALGVHRISLILRARSGTVR